MEDDGDNRRLALDDLEFLAIEGKQWPADIRAEREADGRPCITINKLPTYLDQVVGDQRMNRPSIKVIPVDSDADVKVAKILGGWIKHVQQISKSDVAVDHGFEHAVACGYGAMRVVTEYVSDNPFDEEQEAFIKKVDNALAVYWGPHSEYDCSDAMYCFLIADMPRDEFKDKYNVDAAPFQATDGQFVEGWSSKDTVRVAEYFVKEPITKTLHLLAGNKIVEELEEGDIAIKTKKVRGYRVMWYLLSGNKVLEEREWAGKKYIPIIPIWGKEFNVGGKRKLRGLVRNAKDPQRMYNYWSSCDTEVVALQPKTPYLVTPRQIAGHEDQWNNSLKKSYPYLLTNFDEKAPGWPKRQAPPQASSAMVEKIRMADQEIRDTTGLQQASLGMKSNERSGVAIRERKREGDVGSFAFIDNLARSMEHLGRVLVDVAPGILDTERIVRLGLDDGSHEFEAVNVEADDGKILNDLSIGTYDIVVTVGPSFTTQRTEARQSMQEFIQYYPAAAPLLGDLFAKVMDWPGAEEVAQRLEFLLPPEIKAKKAADAAKKAGAEVPPPPQAPAPPPPDPIMLVKLEEEKVKLEEQKVKLEQERTKLAGLHMQNELSMVGSKEGLRKLMDEILQEEGAADTDALKQTPVVLDQGVVN
jgi:hypothetical protein